MILFMPPTQPTPIMNIQFPTSFLLGTFSMFLAWLANLKVLSVSLWHDAEGDTAANITVSQLPPKQSFSIHVSA